jgi:hypothetical protein
MTKKKPPEEHGKPGRPPGQPGAKKGNTCPNGHTANAHSQCFESTCPHYVRKGQ